MLEFAVGTGRVSVPLLRSGFSMAGLDISRRMMEKARAKGFRLLVQADGMAAPFRDGSFDAVVFVHLIHLVERPADLLREAARVSRVGVFALSMKEAGSRRHRRPDGGAAAAREGGPLRIGGAPGRYARAAGGLGRRQSRLRPDYWSRERELLKTNPPEEFVVVSDVLFKETLLQRAERYITLTGLGQQGRRWSPARGGVVPEVARRFAGLLPKVPRREVHQLAFWDRRSVLRDGV